MLVRRLLGVLWGLWEGKKSLLIRSARNSFKVRLEIGFGDIEKPEEGLSA